jgi:hypothetical protein
MPFGMMKREYTEQNIKQKYTKRQGKAMAT